MSKHAIEPHSNHSDSPDYDHDHGSYRSYLTGFLLSIILTAIPFAIVMTGGFESRAVTVVIIIGFAVVQIFVHMVYFLHMNSRSNEGWTILSMIFTVMVVVIMLAGSLWVMYHLNTNMMPQMDHEQMQGFGS